MLAALDVVLNKYLPGNKTAALHGVPPLMLKDRLSRRVIQGQKSNRQPLLTKEGRKGIYRSLGVSSKSRVWQNSTRYYEPGGDLHKTVSP